MTSKICEKRTSTSEPMSSSSPQSQSSASRCSTPYNNSISLPATPGETPVPNRKAMLKQKQKNLSKNNEPKRIDGGQRDDANGIVKEQQRAGKMSKKKKRKFTNGLRPGDESERDNDSLAANSKRSSRRECISKLSVSNSTLTNVRILLW